MATENKEAQYETIFDQKALDNWFEKLNQAELFAFDLETTSLDYMQAKIVGMSFAINAGEAAYVPLAHSYADAPPQLDRDAVLKQFKPLLEDPNKAKGEKQGQNKIQVGSNVCHYCHAFWSCSG